MIPSNDNADFDIDSIASENHPFLNTYVFPLGVNVFRRNSYEAKYIPVAGTSTGRENI